MICRSEESRYGQLAAKNSQNGHLKGFVGTASDSSLPPTESGGELLSLIANRSHCLKKKKCKQPPEDYTAYVEKTKTTNK